MSHSTQTYLLLHVTNSLPEHTANSIFAGLVMVSDLSIWVGVVVDNYQIWLRRTWHWMSGTNILTSTRLYLGPSHLTSVSSQQTVYLPTILVLWSIKHRWCRKCAEYATTRNGACLVAAKECSLAKGSDYFTGCRLPKYTTVTGKRLPKRENQTLVTGSRLP